MENITINQTVFIKARKTAGQVYDLPSMENCQNCPNSCQHCSNGGQKIQVYVAGPNTLVLCKLVDIEPLITDVFKIGDKVMSTLGGGFTGKVTGFELETNSAICKSDKETGRGRGRWAYNLGEIVPYQLITFNLGDKFRINDKQQIVIMGAQNAKSDYCNIYNAQTNKLMWANVPMINAVQSLNDKYNIMKLERITAN